MLIHFHIDLEHFNQLNSLAAEAGGEGQVPCEQDSHGALQQGQAEPAQGAALHLLLGGGLLHQPPGVEQQLRG